MKKEYENPTIEIIELSTDNILATSGTYGNGVGSEETEGVWDIWPK